MDNPKNRTRIETQVHLFKTPTTNLSTTGSGQPPSKRRAGGHGPNLKDETEHTNDAWVCEDGRDFGPAVWRWERLMGRPAPEPTEAGTRGNRRLHAPFVEWMMGLPAGWVTDPEIGLRRSEQIHVLGNGVVVQQAVAAFAWLLDFTDNEENEAS